MSECALFWIANGFQPGDPTRTDDFSRACLKLAVERYSQLKQQGYTVHFPVIHSVIRDQTGDVMLYETLINEALRAGVEYSDLGLTGVKTTGSPTDGLAIAIFAREHPQARIEVFATTRQTARFFSVMYRAVARHIAGYSLDFTIRYPEEARGGLVSRLAYTALWLTASFAGLTKPTFVTLYNLLNRLYERRLKGFEVTVR